MKYDLNEFRLFRDNHSSLQETSKDSSGDKPAFMTNAAHKVINFDDVKTQYLNELNMTEEKAASADALFCGKDDKIYFIEFKNGKLKYETHNIQKKLRDSIMMFCSITGEQIEFTRKNMRFILVYDGDKNPFDYVKQIAIGKARLAKTSTPLLEFNKIEGFCYERLYAFSKEEFNGKIVDKLF